LEELGRIRQLVRQERTIDGWQILECAIPGDPSRVAYVLRALLDSGVCVARLERIEPSLAGLISRIIHVDATVATHA
jgi:hypothetical protein